MSKNELATQPKQKNALMALSERLSISPEKLQETLKKTVFKNCKTDEEFAVMVAVSNEYDLNPLTKQIYAFPAKGGGVEPIVSIDGWLKIINSHPQFDGMEVVVSEDASEATCTIYVKDRSHPTVITEYLAECKRNTDPWNTMPKRMMRNKSIIQCGRVAFGIGGIYDQDEGEQVAMRDVTPEKKSLMRDEVINPFPKQEETTTEPEKAPQTVVKDPEGKQKKKRYESKGVKLLSVAEKATDSGKAFFVVALSNGTKTVELTTFSTTIGNNLRELEKGTTIDITYTESKGQLSLEEYTLLNN